MKPETTGIELLAAAEQTLAREVAPALSGEARYKTLMAASAIRIVMRELAEAHEAAAAAAGLTDCAALSAAIRRGVHDGDRSIYKALMADAKARTRLSNPSYAAMAETL